ncbi:CaiB/BaiF CoA transferase family protein [Kaistia adipata]|uniref:CaiB/BaiF CoA transferase family protein n=1 Tax=Kaistia adipata TaxID=166954 RepID=UPI000423C984|nr:CaiB/BaiF CoA-transferase family protein [Kaistia adipata]
MKLEGLRVLDLSLFLPGPMLTQTMADHGAEVIKIEPPGEGEPVRNVGYRTSDGVSVWFRNTHRGKKSIVLDFKSPAGVAAFLRLCETADVVVEAFRPGVVDRLGVGYDAVSKVNPRIVYASISAFGQTGPEVKRPAHDIAIEALAGVVSLNLGGDGQPTNPHMPVADMAGSMTAFAGILMALLRREKTGRGDYLDISMQDSTMAWLPNVTGPVFAEDRAPRVKEERSFGGYAFFSVYETADHRHVVLGGVEHKFVRNLLNALERPDLIPLAEGPPGPTQEPVQQFLRATFAMKTRAEWEAWFADKDVCFAPVLDLHEAFHQPHIAAREMLHRDVDGNLHIGTPIRYRDEPGRLDTTLPALGEHTAEVLRQAGLDDAAIAEILAGRRG